MSVLKKETSLCVCYHRDFQLVIVLIEDDYDKGKLFASMLQRSESSPRLLKHKTS